MVVCMKREVLVNPIGGLQRIHTDLLQTLGLTEDNQGGTRMEGMDPNKSVDLTGEHYLQITGDQQKKFLQCMEDGDGTLCKWSEVLCSGMGEKKYV